MSMEALSTRAGAKPVRSRHRGSTGIYRNAMSMRSWVGASALLSLLAAVPAGATNVTGTELLAECSAVRDSAAHKQCVSYIAGVVDGIDTLITSLRLLHPLNGAYPRLYCLPPGTAATSLVAPTVDYLQKYPGTLHYGASSEVLLALKQAYPCASS